MTRAISAKITDVTGQPRDGLLVVFHATDGFEDAMGMTDATGIFTVDLVPLVTYRVSVENSVIVEGQPFPAGTVFEVTVQDGEGPVLLLDATIVPTDASRPALLDRLAVLDATVIELETRIAALETH